MMINKPSHVSRGKTVLKGFRDQNYFRHVKNMFCDKNNCLKIKLKLSQIMFKMVKLEIKKCNQ